MKTYDWRAEFARAEQAHHRAEAYADGLLDLATDDLNPWERELLRSRAAAARADAWAWATYADHCESAVEQGERRSRYDTPVPGVYSPAQLMREHAPGHPVGYQSGPGGRSAVFCKVDGCDFHDVIDGKSA